MNIPYLNLGKVNATYQEKIDAAAMTVLHSGYYLYGEQVDSFRRAWARYNDADYCVTTANGLDALTASLSALKLLHQWPDGSEVLVSGLTFIASFEAISRAGLQPVPVDVSEADYLMDIHLAEQSISPKTVAIMPVNIYGRHTDMRPWRALAEEHSLCVVVDACQMHGNVGQEEPIVNYCDAVAYSFYPGKNLGAFGDAGCLITNNQDLAEVAQMYCNYGSVRKYHHQIQGMNSRMDEIQAAILNAKLPDLRSSNARRQSQAAIYNRGIHNPHIALPYGATDEEKSVWHIYPVFSQARDRLQTCLLRQGVQTLIHYPIPPHKQKAYKELNALCLPVSERLCQTELSLPLNPALTSEQQSYIIDKINKFDDTFATDLD